MALKYFTIKQYEDITLKIPLMRTLVIIVLHFLTILLVKCYGQAPVYPETSWEKSEDVSSYGWNPDSLSRLKQFIITQSNTTGIIAIYKGKVIFEYGNLSDNSYIASCRKSILALLYGPYVENGNIDLDESLIQLGIDDIGGLLPIEKKATIRNLLTARSGIYHSAGNDGDQSDKAPKRGSVTPGSYFLYNNWDFNAAGYILETKTHKNIYDLVDSLLAKPLEMQDWRRDLQRKYGDTTKSQFKAYHMWFSTRDMARIGYMMLQHGKWKNVQVIPEQWLNLITTPVTSNAEASEFQTNYFDFSYGYLWWIWGPDYPKSIYRGGYTATGAFGQFITVIPSLDLVVAHKTNYDDYQRSTSTELYLRILDKLISAKN